MSKISTIFILFLSGLVSLLCGCVHSTHTATSTPQTLIGKVEPSSRIFSRFLFSEDEKEPYNYAFYDTDGNFVAYVNIDNIVSPSFDNIVNRPIIARGVLEESERGKIFKIDYVQITR